MLKETSSQTSEIIIINKKSFLKTLKKHLSTFEKILNKKIEPRSFLTLIEKGEISFSESIQNNEILLGICLGYGENNANLYYLRNKILQNQQLDFFGDYNYSLMRINSLHFIANHQLEETRKLKTKYQNLRAKISAIYSRGEFLEITLSRLSS